MKKKSWRENLDLLINENIKELIEETKIYNSAISLAKDKSKAQIWVALALLNHKINSKNLKNNTSERKIPDDELGKILKTLEKL